MSAPTALDNARTGTPDGSAGVQIPTVLMQQDSAFEAPCGVALSDRLPAGMSPDRAGLSANDVATVDMSTAGFAGSAGANLSNINNRGALVVWCEFANAAGSATVEAVFYDDSNNPLFVSEQMSFSALTNRVSSSGDFMSRPQMIDTFGASKYRLFLRAIGTGNVDLFAQPI